eukprot:TRINITY_DN93959_c0_g1_i1.p2 TRINITY_DN93959_c0_g1~~TRINITY_DN93959_c0_g1_i1.p2  ORF type:complete len:142 (+),score=4.18 TRINITY_DN93959_c0_g1_i1:33-428(+)
MGYITRKQMAIVSKGSNRHFDMYVLSAKGKRLIVRGSLSMPTERVVMPPPQALLEREKVRPAQTRRTRSWQHWAGPQAQQIRSTSQSPRSLHGRRLLSAVATPRLDRALMQMRGCRGIALCAAYIFRMRSM